MYVGHVQLKFMGSKRVLLKNGLGEAIVSALRGRERFVDLFTGSGSVAWYVAERCSIPVLANDLQRFGGVLAKSVIGRTRVLDEAWIEAWLCRAARRMRSDPLYCDAARLQAACKEDSLERMAAEARALCCGAALTITGAYGGYYFSPLQSLLLDYLRKTLPRGADERSVAMGAVVQTASQCAAAPGHTAQPFRANATAGPFLREAWGRDVLDIVGNRAREINCRKALVKGKARRRDANLLSRELSEKDLVFVDPPYSAVQYSRFYHVLETVAVGRELEVSGTGRYPPARDRPRSKYSLVSSAKKALCGLLDTLSVRGCGVLITFPAGLASNGLSGETVVELAESRFTVESAKIGGRFSTLGGNRRNRSARQSAEELILTLESR